jgi:hypothetical protein
MKLVTLIVLYLAISQISLDICGAVARRSHHRRSKAKAKTHRRGVGENKWYNLFVGIFSAATGQADTQLAAINKCLPASWQAVDLKPVPEENAPAEPKSTFTTILDGVQSVVEFICKFKKEIAGLFGKKYMSRVFVETGMRRYGKALGFWGGVKEKFKKVGNWIKKKWNELISFGKEVAENLNIFVSNIKSKVTGFISGDFLGKIKEIVSCGSKSKDIAPKIVGIVKGVIEKVSLISSIAAGNLVAIAKLLVDLICNFKIFREAFSNLADGINEKNPVKKFGLIGRFIGGLIKALTTRRLRRLSRQ